MKKIVKVLLPLLALSNSAFAGCCGGDDGVKVRLSGSVDFTAAAIDDSGPKDRKRISANHDHFGFYNTAKFAVNAENQIDADTKYGATIAVATATRNARSTPTEFYFESQAGRLELGSGKSAVSKMKITGGTSAVAAKGAWDTWVKADIRDNQITYFSNMGNFLDTKTRDLKHIEYSRKMTYFTPKLNGFQFGLSYIPDTSNAGGNTVKDAVYHVKNSMSPGFQFAIKDGLAWGATYENSFSDDFSLKLALVGEKGKVIAKEIEDAATPTTNPNAKFKNLKTYTFGANVEYGDLSFSIAYADYMKSLTTADIEPGRNRDIKIFSTGLGYHYGNMGFSVMHFHSKAKKNALDATTFGVDYKLAPGLLPYAEITSYSTDGRYLDAGTYKKDKYHGTFGVVGVKLEF